MRSHKSPKPPPFQDGTKDATKPRGSSTRRKSSGIRGDVGGGGGGGGDGGGELEASVHKLEQDYIQMYLGELTPMQESKLVQLKSRVAELLKGKVPSDQVFLRCVVASIVDGLLFD